MMCFHHCTSLRMRQPHSCIKRDASVCKAYQQGYTILVLALYVSQVLSAAPSISVQRAKALAGALRAQPSQIPDETDLGVLPQEQETVASGKYSRLIENILGAISEPEIAQGLREALARLHVRTQFRISIQLKCHATWHRCTRLEGVLFRAGA